MSANRILVVGGYGAVGATVAAMLGGWFPGRVVVVGRDEARARTLGGVRADVADPDGFRRTLEELGDVAAVVLCVEPPDSRVARVCLERGVHLVDIGATWRLLDATAALHGAAAASGATAVLSVGVAPGLTNLLARRAHEAVGGADRIDLTVLLGAGERHGADAVRWTVEGLAEPPAGAPLRTTLPGHGRRTAHPFPFSDQHTLPRTLGVQRVTTRLCLDSGPLTAALFGLRAAARRPPVRRALTASFSRIHLGGDGFALRADARRGDRHAACAVTGREQSRFTALVASYVTRELLTGTPSPGVHHIEQLPALSGLPETLTAHGLTVWRPGGPAPEA
ncbi:saccharopine dehydrogenase NADP-binding domain-containing protein [Streptomyces sp. NRRL F-2664]|uniref:saccharopine dehydrogenase NADP-binding domain-containing protein n=1 Tax=Streptomyces sp. NRRL F-2664 TaxID=1463842 RepID=UPI0004C9320A|nr:saccharopine dehydrogenase NADP-binding domain-containing protein [Streptomyces sp. NRRL F-2664]